MNKIADLPDHHNSFNCKKELQLRIDDQIKMFDLVYWGLPGGKDNELLLLIRLLNLKS